MNHSTASLPFIGSPDHDPTARMNNNLSLASSQLPAIWLLISNYESHFVGGAFALTALLSLGFLFYVFHHRASNQVGALLSTIFFISLVFSAARSLLIVNSLLAGIESIIAGLDPARIPSICALFTLVFVAIVRSSVAIFSRANFVTKLACVIWLLLNYAIAFAPMLMEKYSTGYTEIIKAVQVGIIVYFMTVLSIISLAFMAMLPGMLTTARSAKRSISAPNRLVSAALIGFLSAFILIIYVLFLLLGFLLIQPGLHIDLGEKWKENSLILRQLQIIGQNMVEALLTAFLVIATVLLIKTEKYPETALASAPEMQGLLYPGRDTTPIILGSGTNGYHTLSKTNHRHPYG